MASGVLDGQPVSASVTNAAFLAKNGDDTATGKINLGNSDPTSGPPLSNAQRELNSLISYIGKTAGQAFDAKPAWSDASVGTSLDTLSARAEALTAKFNPTSGHSHDGVDSRKIPATNLGSVGATSGQVPVADGSGGVVWSDVGGGGGGGSLQWVEDADSPVPATENADQIYRFEKGLGQKLYALIRVPSGYSAGKQIKLRTVFSSPDSSGTALLQTVATLIRPSTDAMDSVTNQRTSTNAAVALGAGTVGKPQAVVCDLTDATGKINGVAVSPGDLIRIQLTRGTDTGASDLKVPVYATEVSFNG